MNEPNDRLKGIRELPIFPLPIVLMPFEILPLHIFEPRYRQLLADIESGNKMFGLHFFEPKDEFERFPEVGSIGCVAEIREVQMLEDGRSNILTCGVSRYRIGQQIETDKLYSVAEVEFFEDEPEDETTKKVAADTVFGLFDRIAKAAFKMSAPGGKAPEVEQAEPGPMSFLVAAAFNLETEQKSMLVEMTSTTERLRFLEGILTKVVRQMESNAETHEISRTNGHGKTKLDL